MCARWAGSVPADFRFPVKLPKTITHERRLSDCEGELHAFLEQAGGLGARLGCLLVQLPPSLAFDADAASRFLQALARRMRQASENAHEVWCIFDNTAAGAAANNALALLHALRQEPT